MFQLDDQFLKDLGLDQLPDGQKQAFLDHIYSELELRVGVKLSDGLSDDQLSEFEAFVDRKYDRVQLWVSSHAPDYINDPTYIQLRSNARGVSEPVLLAEYASLKWLGMNRPDYKEVVAQVLQELKGEIMLNRDAILGQSHQAA